MLFFSFQFIIRFNFQLFQKKEKKTVRSFRLLGMFKLTINFILLFFISITLSFKLPTLSYNQLSKTLTIKGTGILRSSNELKGYLSQAEYVIVEEGFNLFNI